jgi:hypothetical protein
MYFGFPCQFLFNRLLHIYHHLSSGAGTIGQIVTEVPSGLSLTPTQETIKKTKKCETDGKENYVHRNYSAASVQWRRDVSTGTLNSMRTELRRSVAFTVSGGLRLAHLTLNGWNAPFENEVNYFDAIFG